MEYITMLDEDLRRAAGRSFNAMKLMLDIDLVLPLNYAAVLLFVASRGHDGATVQDIQRAIGMTQPATARAVQRLTTGSRSSVNVGVGLGLLEKYPDPKEERRFLYTLSQEGRRVVTNYVAFITEGLSHDRKD